MKLGECEVATFLPKPSILETNLAPLLPTCFSAKATAKAARNASPAAVPSTTRGTGKGSTSMVSALQERCQGRAGWYVCQAGSQYEPKTKSESKLRKFSQNSVKNGRCYCQSTVVTNMAPRSPRVTSTEGPFSTKVLAAARTSSLPKCSSESSGCESIWLWTMASKWDTLVFFGVQYNKNSLSQMQDTNSHLQLGVPKKSTPGARGHPSQALQLPLVGTQEVDDCQQVGWNWPILEQRSETTQNFNDETHFPALCTLCTMDTLNIYIYIYIYSILYIYREKMHFIL